MDEKALVILALGSLAAGFAYIYLRKKTKAVRRNYDVFLNFRGQDSRGTLAEHLHNRLVNAEFAVFKDDCELLSEQIEKGLRRAIKNSKIAILIISKRYGGSEWCLAELAMIMRRYAEKRLSVLPVFYEVNDSDVRNQTGVFGEAFRELAEHHPPREVREWKKALRSVTRIRGWTSEEVAAGEQAKLVDKVVKKVSSELRRSWIERNPMFRETRRESNCQVFLTPGPASKYSLVSFFPYILQCKKISVFGDDDEYLIGKDFAHEIRNAINHCKIFIPIITRDFASSPDCLNNLAQMVECFRPNGSMILPIFYEVEPSQNLLDCFQRDMLQHNVLQDTRQQWQESLEEVWLIGGLVSANINNGDEVELVKSAVEAVCALLERPNA